jgi:hypothetical protein
MNESTTSTLLEQKLKEAELLSLQEHSQRKAEADLGLLEARWCRDKAAKYLDEAQKVEGRVKRLRVEAENAKHQHDSWRFEALCHALQRNDPALTAVRPLGTDYPMFPGPNKMQCPETPKMSRRMLLVTLDKAPRQGIINPTLLI